MKTPPTDLTTSGAEEWRKVSGVARGRGDPRTGDDAVPRQSGHASVGTTVLEHQPGPRLRRCSRESRTWSRTSKACRRSKESSLEVLSDEAPERDETRSGVPYFSFAAERAVAALERFIRSGTSVPLSWPSLDGKPATGQCLTAHWPFGQ